jgi:prephenate dehydratase
MSGDGRGAGAPGAPASSTLPGPGGKPSLPRPRVAYSGEPGAFAEDAVVAFFADPLPVPVPGFREVFAAVTAGRVAADPSGAAPVVAGVVPIENLVNGTVRENYDLLLEHDVEIRGEIVVPVHLCLAALPGERIDGIERVYSHIQALGQADRFLRGRPWQLLTTYNTAAAGVAIAERDERAAAAVLSPRAATLAGLEILADGIQTVPDNRTRFVVVARPGMDLPDALLRTPAFGQAVARRTTTTLVLGVRNEPGTLMACLAVLADEGINMHKLESRPSLQRAWEYVFWVDVDGDVRAPAMARALERLSSVTTLLRVLGSYPRAEA